MNIFYALFLLILPASAYPNGIYWRVFRLIVRFFPLSPKPDRRGTFVIGLAGFTP
jgi:hypothetical protein